MRPVSRKHKKLAQLMARDAARVEWKGIQAAKRVSLMVQRAAYAALRTGSNPITAARRELPRAIAPLVDAMVAAHLIGRKRTVANASIAASESEAFSALLSKLQVQLGVTPDELARLTEKYSAEVVRTWTKASDVLEAKLRDAFTTATRQGMHVREGTGLLRKAFVDAGITPDNSYTIENIFRTQTQLAYSAGRYSEEQRPEVQEILWGYEYVTAGDSRVRPSHAALEGTRAPKDDSIWRRIYPPNGYSCRCQAIPIFEKQTTVYPKPTVELPSGQTISVGPDRGFQFNPGLVWGDSGYRFGGLTLSAAWDESKVARDERGRFISTGSMVTIGGIGKGIVTGMAADGKIEVTDKKTGAVSYHDSNVLGRLKTPDPDKMTMVKTLSGSTHPSLMTDEHGKQWVVKTGASKEHAGNEQLANTLYQAAGIQTPDSFSKNGKVINEFISGDTLSQLTGEQKAAARLELRKGFIVDAWLGNRDVIGTGSDNIMMSKDGQVYRIDNGGSMFFRAQGGQKPFPADVTPELNGLRDNSKNKDAANVFNGITYGEMKAQTDNLAKTMTDDKIKTLVKDPMIADALIARRNFLTQKFAKEDAQALMDQPKSATPPKGLKPAASEAAVPSTTLFAESVHKKIHFATETKVFKEHGDLVMHPKFGSGAIIGQQSDGSLTVGWENGKISKYPAKTASALKQNYEKTTGQSSKFIPKPPQSASADMALHPVFGVGKKIGVKPDGYVTVKYDNGKEMSYAPKTFAALNAKHASKTGVKPAPATMVTKPALGAPATPATAPVFDKPYVSKLQPGEKLDIREGVKAKVYDYDTGQDIEQTGWKSNVAFKTLPEHELRMAASKWADTIPPLTVSSIKKYTGDDYSLMRDVMRRKGLGFPLGPEDAKAVKRVERIDKLLKAESTPKYQGTVYRGLRFINKAKFDAFVGTLQSGSFSDWSVSSWTRRPGMAFSWSSPGSSTAGSVVLRVVNSKKSVNINTQKLTPHSGEYESLYPSAVKWKVRSIRRRKNVDKADTLYVDLIEVD